MRSVLCFQPLIDQALEATPRILASGRHDKTLHRGAIRSFALSMTHFQRARLTNGCRKTDCFS